MVAATPPVTLDGQLLASGHSLEDGSYVLTTVARRPGTLVASVPGASSAPVPLRIRPRLSARITGLKVLGAPLVLKGVLQPADAGRLRATAGSRERAVRVGADGAFRWAVPTRHAGKMCVRLSLTPATGYVGGVRRRCVRIATPLLRLGARGAAVRFLQQRLSRLRYALLGAGGTRSRRSKVSRATGPLTQ